MKNNYLFGLDLGGGGARGLIIEVNTRKTVEIFKPWRQGAITRFGLWGFNFDLDVVWDQVGALTREAMDKISASPQEVMGIAATSMRLSLVVLDKEDNVLLATTNNDARALSQSMLLASEHGEEIYHRTGHWPSPTMMTAKLLWLSENHPEAIQKIRSVLSLSDWVGYKLSGKLAAEHSQAAESGLYDLASRAWDQELMKMFSLPRHIFPELVAAGQKIGLLTANAAGHLGLAAGIPVAAGGGDTQCGLLGLKAVKPGDLGVIAGTTAPIQMVTSNLCIDTQKRLWSGLHVVPDLYVVESNAGSMGATLEWFAKTMYPAHPNPIAALAAQGGEAEPGAGGIFSTIGAEIFNASGMGLPAGQLTLSTMGRAGGEEDHRRTARAFLEGLAFTARANIDQISEVANAEFDVVRVGGGIARSRIWTDILAQVCAKPVHVSRDENVSATGAVICAGVGAGQHADLVSGANALAKISSIEEPDGSKSSAYQELYRDWKNLLDEQKESNLLAADLILERISVKSVDEPAAQITYRPNIYVDADLGEEALVALRQIGEVTYESYREGNVLIGEEMTETLQGYQVFITEVDIVDAEVLPALPDLRMIVVCRGNPTNIDINACTTAGIPVVNTPGRNANAVADLTLTFMLMLARKIQGAGGFLRQPGGEAGDMGRMGVAYFNYCGNELWKKTIGVIGCGAIGQKVIRRLLPFEANILVYDPFVSVEQVNAVGAEKVQLDALLTQSDFITLHAPVTEETKNLLDAEAFAKMKEGVYLVNTARAALVDHDALAAALKSGKLGGAAIDVFPVEPPGSDDPLLVFENLIATPHIGGNTHEVGIHQGLMAAEEIMRLLHGQPPSNLLNPEVMEKFTWTEERHVKKQVLEKLAASSGTGVTDLNVETQKAIEKDEITVVTDSQKESATQGKGFLKRLLSRKSTSKQPAPTTQELVESQPAAGSAQREKFMRLLGRFAELLIADAELKEKSQKTDMVMRFAIKDIDQVFYINLSQGEVTSGVGEPTGEVDLTLKMDADIFDGLFTGRVNGNKAVMTGKMTFSGDTRKAMSMRRYFNIMNTSYQRALVEVGEIGDLTQIGDQVKSSEVSVMMPAASTDHVIQIAASSVPPIMKVGDIRDEILQVMTDFFSKGYITATGGNISARSDNNDDEIWISPSSLYKGDLRADMMVKIDLNGNLIGQNDFSASSERQVHCAIYRNRPEINAVIHSHAPQATLMALSGTKFLPISTEIAFIGEIPVIPFLMPGTPELGEKVSLAIGEHGVVVLMQNHGLVVAGTSLRRAADMTEIIELTAEKLIACRLMGVEPPVLPDDILEELSQIGRMMA